MSEKEKSLEEIRAAIDEDQREQEEVANQSDQDQDQELEDQENASDQDTSTEEKSDEPSEDDQADDNSDQEDWFVPGRFKTPQDVLKSYNELESMAGRQGSEIQRLRAAQETPRQVETTENKQARLEKFAEDLAKDPIEAIKGLYKEETGEIRSEVKAKEFERVYRERMKDAEFAELEPIMTGIAQHYGDMIQGNGLQNDPRILDILQLAAKGIQTAELAKQANAKGVKTGRALQKKKVKARIEGSSGTKGKSRKLNVDNMTAAEMKAAVEKGDLKW